MNYSDFMSHMLSLSMTLFFLKALKPVISTLLTAQPAIGYTLLIYYIYDMSKDISYVLNHTLLQISAENTTFYISAVIITLAITYGITSTTLQQFKD